MIIIFNQPITCNNIYGLKYVEVTNKIKICKNILKFIMIKSLT